MKRSPLKRGKPKRWHPSPEGRAFWDGQRAKVRERSGGQCERILHHESKCEDDDQLWRCPNDYSDTSHVIPLGRGRSRWDEADKLNALDNLEGLCRLHHGQHEAEARAKHARWMKGDDHEQASDQDQEG